MPGKFVKHFHRDCAALLLLFFLSSPKSLP